MKTRRGEGVKGDNRKIWEGKEGGGGGVREGEDATKRRMECRTEAYIDTLPAGQADLQLISIVLYNTLAPEDSARTSALQEPVQFNKYATETVAGGQQDEIGWAFKMFDIDNSGSIVVEEINQSVQVLIIHPPLLNNLV